MISFKLTNGRGKQRDAAIDEVGSLLTTEAPRPPFGGKTTMRLLRQHLTDDGLVTDGTNQDMRVDGSSTTQEFYIQAHETRDRYICILSFVLADANQSMNEFGNFNSELSNGCRLFYDDFLGEVDIHEGIKKNFDFVRLCGGNPAFGDAGTVFRVNNASGTAEGYFQNLDCRTYFGFRWGIRLAAGTQQKLAMQIRDDLSSGIDQFDVIAYGFERLPD